jgi:trimeric autotransporter adhesin
VFSDVTDPAASVTVSQVGTYIFTWTETNGICVSTDAVTVNFYHQTVADAGNGGNECDLDFLLNAQPSFGVGTWTQTAGPGFANFIPNANAPNATAQVSQYGTYTFTWTEVDGICTSNDAITVNFYPQPVANAGPDANECDLDHVFAAVPSAGIGTWTQVSGPGTTTFLNPNSATTTGTATIYGTYVYQWQEVSGTCTSSDQMTVNYYLQPVADAGPDANECDLDHVLAAVLSSGNGTWAQSSGPGSAVFVDASSPTSTVIVDAYGIYTFTWIEVNGTCTSSDAVTVNFYQQPVANAGTGGNECDLNFLFSAQPSFGTGAWTYTGPGVATFNNSTSPVATVTVNTYGAYVFTWTETNGTCVDSDAVTVNFYEQPVANAGNGGSECDLDFTLNATLTTGTGVWTQISGTGISVFDDATDPNTDVTVSLVGTYIYRWTETNGVCVSTDQVTVNYYHQPVADAGNGGDECDLDFVLNAQPSFGVGTWTQTAGPGFASYLPNANNPNATVQVSQYGTYQFTWTEVDGICSSSDQITVNFYPQPVAEAGRTQMSATLTTFWLPFQVLASARGRRSSVQELRYSRTLTLQHLW